MKFLQRANWFLVIASILFGFDGAYKVLTHDFAKTPSISPLATYAVAAATLLLSVVAIVKSVSIQHQNPRPNDIWVPAGSVLALSQLDRLVSVTGSFQMGSIVLCVACSGVSCWFAFRDPRKWERTQ